MHLLAQSAYFSGQSSFTFLQTLAKSLCLEPGFPQLNRTSVSGFLSSMITPQTPQIVSGAFSGIDAFAATAPVYRKETSCSGEEKRRSK